jgi:hypothetical protein
MKRFIRPGLIISAVVHVGALLLGFLLVGANSFESMPPPDAMVVDIVPPPEPPRFEGTPSELRSSGTEAPNTPQSVGAAAQPPPPKPAPKSPQTEQHPNPQRDARQTTEPPKTAAPQLASAETAQQEIAPTETSESPPPPPQPETAEPPDPSSTVATMAQQALAGGRLGGGFNAPPVDTNRAGYDFTAPFRERVSSCLNRIPGLDANDRVEVVLRVFLNRDGTVGAQPIPLAPIITEKQELLRRSVMSALERCQPYTMLPPDKYKLWKKLDLLFYPLNFPGG